MNNKDFTLKCIDVVANKLTRYGQGGWLQHATPENIQWFLTNPMWPKNSSNETIRDGLLSATPEYLIGDCVCTVKSILDNLVGVDKQTTAMRKPCPDITVEDMLYKQCVDISTNFDNILIGEFVTYADYSHCGVYAGIINGKRMVAENTYRFKNGFQLIDMDCTDRKGMWKYHGKLWNFMDYTFKGTSLYSDVKPAPAVDTSNLKKFVDLRVLAKKGDKGMYIEAIQKVLIQRGYPCGKTGADGDFGSNTEKAVKAFQKASKLTQDGIVGYDTIVKLIG